MKNTAYLAQSLDGYIADTHGNIDFLHSIDNPKQDDFGFHDFLSNIDAILMGRRTYETVLSLGGQWPYDKPVFVMSQTIKSIPDVLWGKVVIVQAALKDVLSDLHQQGLHNLYIDGAQLVQSMLREDLLDELILSTVPVLLGDGVSLFNHHTSKRAIQLNKVEVLLNQISKQYFVFAPA